MANVSYDPPRVTTAEHPIALLDNLFSDATVNARVTIFHFFAPRCQFISSLPEPAGLPLPSFALMRNGAGSSGEDEDPAIDRRPRREPWIAAHTMTTQPRLGSGAIPQVQVPAALEDHFDPGLFESAGTQAEQ